MNNILSIRGLSNTYTSRPLGLFGEKQIKLLQNPGDGLMSKCTDKIMDGLYGRFENYSVSEIVRYTHDLPEWKKKESSIPSEIDVRDILLDAKYSEKDITGTLAFIEETTAMLHGLALATVMAEEEA